MPLTTKKIPDLDYSRRQLHLRRIGLRVLTGPDAGGAVEIDHDLVRIGSDPECDLVLTDPTVSRRHAEIARTPEGLVLRDNQSRNGTFVGSLQINDVYLRDVPEFRVGRTEIALEVLDEVVDIVPAAETTFEDIVGASVAMRSTFAVVDRVARTDLTVLVTGETGTGKELVSRALHRRSARRNGPLVVFDCGAVARNLVESELFGHERGAFTGAVAARAGVFEQAHGGTIVLDELGELPIDLQPALLRVLEQREVRRVGDRTVRPVDVRVVAATNRDLRALVREGRFREDLYYRLAVVEIALPPLRDRIEDLPLLVDHLLRTQGSIGGREVRGVTADVLTVLRSYRWPGNVRELRNTVLRAIPFCAGDWIDMEALPEALREEHELLVRPDPDESEDSAPVDLSGPARAALPLPAGDLPLRDAKEVIILAFERRYLADLLERCDGNLSKAARVAGVDRKTIARMLERHRLRSEPT